MLTASAAQAKTEEDREANIVNSLSLLPILPGPMALPYISYTLPSVNIIHSTVMIHPQTPLHIPRVDVRIHDTRDVRGSATEEAMKPTE